MEGLHQIRDMLCEEVDQLAQKGDMSMSDLDKAYKMSGFILNSYKIDMLKRNPYSRESMRGGSYDSYADRSYANGSYADDSYDSYANDSYADGYSGRHYVAGHYSRAEGDEMLKKTLRKKLQEGGLNNTDRFTLQKALEIIDK